MADNAATRALTEFDAVPIGTLLVIPRHVMRKRYADTWEDLDTGNRYTTEDLAGETTYSLIEQVQR